MYGSILTNLWGLRVKKSLSKWLYTKLKPNLINRLIKRITTLTIGFYNFQKNLDMPDIYRLTFFEMDVIEIKRIWARS